MGVIVLKDMLGYRRYVGIVFGDKYDFLYR